MMDVRALYISKALLVSLPLRRATLCLLCGRGPWSDAPFPLE